MSKARIDIEGYVANEPAFWSKVTIGASHECWPWNGARQSGKWAYGRLTYGGRWVSAHRLAWQLTNRTDVPAGMVIRHSCDNPPCVNPGHLMPGTPKENSRDMRMRGRTGYTGLKGSLNHQAKITSFDVASLRSDRGDGLSWSALGRKYGISKAHARRVALGINWKEVA